MIEKAVIDFSAFVGFDKKVLVKELTIVDVASLAVQHWVFKPPKSDSQKRGDPVGAAAGVGHDCAGFHYEPPFSGHNEWLSKHFHGLSFESGSTEYESLQQALRHYCCGIQVLYAASDEKAKELECLLDQQRAVISLEALGCPPLPRGTLTPGFGDEGEQQATEAEGKGEGQVSIKQCLLHRMQSPGFYCTQSNALRLVAWCRAHPEMLDMNKVENRLKTFGGQWKITTPSPSTLAELGFVRLQSTSDTTKCVYCGLCLFKWQEGDDAAEDHEYNSPFCMFLRFKHQARRAKDDDASKNRNKNSDCLLTRMDNLVEEDHLFALCHA